MLTRKDNFPEYIQTLKDKVVQIYKLQDACAGPTPQSVSIKKPEPEVIETPVQSANIEPAEKYPSSGNLELIQKEPKKLRKNSKWYKLIIFDCPLIPASHSIKEYY